MERVVKNDFFYLINNIEDENSEKMNNKKIE